MAERQPVVKRSCAFCQDAERETLEQTLLDGNMTVKQMDKEMGWRANTADRHFRNHMGDYHMAANPSCVICTHPQRAEFESQYFDGGMTSDEIAAAAECPESTVYHHIKTINIMKVELAKESPETWKRIKEELVGQMGEDL